MRVCVGMCVYMYVSVYVCVPVLSEALQKMAYSIFELSAIQRASLPEMIFPDVQV